MCLNDTPDSHILLPFFSACIQSIRMYLSMNVNRTINAMSELVIQLLELCNIQNVLEHDEQANNVHSLISEYVTNVRQ